MHTRQSALADLAMKMHNRGKRPPFVQDYPLGELIPSTVNNPFAEEDGWAMDPKQIGTMPIPIGQLPIPTNRSPNQYPGNNVGKGELVNAIIRRLGMK